MGIPKFFRWMSERYPVCSQLVEENRIPEFDNLYLDMNGIFHQCSHSNDAEIDWKLPEEEVFEKVCVYIEKLFSIIQPKKTFFMAVDGVAPRAKMNQQRSRRFRSAQEHQQKRLDMEEEKEMGIPAEALFDSNCITPGTEFMEQLSRYLQEFVQEKIRDDPTWQNLQVILSGHEVPGEGEHKIMDYIRALKSSPKHDPNTRHCLYGLDADLIMLSLVTHEPHFALLREEVKFVNKPDANDKKNPIFMKKKLVDSPDEQRYYLMHIGLLREYLELEFQSQKPELFDFYDPVKLIDDFVLICIFIGNDFLPHLPHLHIHDAALTHLLYAYKEVLKEQRHYMNIQGHLHLPTLSAFFERIIYLEKKALEVHLSNQNTPSDKDSDDWYSSRDEEEMSDRNGRLDEDVEDEDNDEEDDEDITNGVLPSQYGPKLKQTKELSRKEKLRSQVKVPYTITPAQRVLVERLLEFVVKDARSMHFTNVQDPGFLLTLCTQLNMTISIQEGGGYKLEKPPELPKAVGRRNGAAPLRDDFGNDIGPMDPIILLEDYLNCRIGNTLIDTKPLNRRKTLEEEWHDWKLHYYTKKLEFKADDLPHCIHEMTCTYVRGLQWVLLYYYEGVASWDWFFPYHYAPFISDLAEMDMECVNLSFNLDSPFYPFEQLFAVLPEASGNFLPEPIRALMSHKKFEAVFPTEFESDLNGKKHDWEKVIKLPFIDCDAVRSTIRSRLHLLTPEEQARNQFGVAHLYQSSSTTRHSDNRLVQCCVQEYTVKKPKKLVKGLCIGIEPRAGFPCLKYLSIGFQHAYHNINVFGRPSRNESIVLYVQPKSWDDPMSIAKMFIGKSLYFQWPYLMFGLVVKVGSGDLMYDARGKSRLMNPDEQTEFEKRRKVVHRVYNRERGIMLPPIQVMLYIRRFIGMKKNANLSTVREYAERPQWVPWDLVLPDFPFLDPRLQEHPPKPLREEYPVGAEVFLLGPQYGSPGRITRVDPSARELEGRFLCSSQERPLDFGRQFVDDNYTPLSNLVLDLGISGSVISRLTSDVMVVMKTDEVWNLGLKLKYTKQALMVPGLTRFRGGHWEFSQRCYELIFHFISRFPHFVRRIEEGPRGGGVCYTPFDFYSTVEVAHDQLSKIKQWLDALPELPAASMHDQLMTREEIQDLEAALEDSITDIPPPPPPTLHTLRRIPLERVLKTDHARLRLEHQTFDLGDRVMVINVPGKMCAGAHGYVVGILQDGRVQVRLDTSFRGGGDLRGRCAPSHGITVLHYQVLNLTRPHILAHQPSTPRTRGRTHARDDARRPASTDRCGSPTGKVPTNGYVNTLIATSPPTDSPGSPTREIPQAVRSGVLRVAPKLTLGQKYLPPPPPPPADPMRSTRASPAHRTPHYSPPQNGENLLEKLQSTFKNTTVSMATYDPRSADEITAILKRSLNITSAGVSRPPQPQTPSTNAHRRPEPGSTAQQRHQVGKPAAHRHLFDTFEMDPKHYFDE